MARLTDITSESLSPGPTTFTLERIQSQLRKDTFQIAPNSSGEGIPSPFICEGLEYSIEDGVHRYYTKMEQNGRREKLCRDLYEKVLDGKSHCPRLDDRFSKIVLCNFQLNGTENISDRTYNLLTRLPARPLELHDVPPTLSPDYLIPSSSRNRYSTTIATLWHQLQVTSYVSTNVIRTALLSAIYHGRASHMLRNLVDTIADLLTTAGTLSLSADSELAKQRWFVVQVFLWTSWQRCTMIYFYSILAWYLESGFHDDDGPSLILRGMLLSPGISIQEISKNYASLKKPQYMCGWAFELLRSNPVCIGLDFRRFFLRYCLAFGDRPGRCILDHHSSCKGDEPDQCQRFKGMRIENQSAHDLVCQGDCKRLTWDEDSYRSVSGARAVAFEIDESRETLIYRRASADTLAISHVWSHGQGGRPEAGHGFNHCLHRRYVSIAKSLGCDSYWMDTPCIPEDHKLRREAIENINKVFEQSKATVVCDKDLMEINASDLSVEVRELILGTVMVCDWNLRAWTFLEAFRGRESIYILCKDNVTVSLKETVEIVQHQGSIDIALLLLSVPHLLPPRVKRDFENRRGDNFVSGFLTIETGGSLLSHRAASRPGDDIVIWSLLLDDKVYKNAKAFWKSRRGQHHYNHLRPDDQRRDCSALPTSFLVSSVPRLKKRGLGWAPSSPTAQLIQIRSHGPKVRLLAFDGTESESGLVTRDGFLAKWLLYDFIGTCTGANKMSSILKIDVHSDDQSCRANLREIRHRYLKGYIWGALLRPIDINTYRDPAPNRGDTSKTLVVVCATNKRFNWPWETDDRIHWQWRGVYEWDMAEPLPKFVNTQDVLLV